MTSPHPLDYQPPPPKPRVDLDFWAYLLPMALFLGLTQIGASWKQLYPLSYLIKTVVVAAALVLLWPRYTRIRWNHWWLGVIVGVIGILQWVGMQLWLQQFEFFKPSPDVFNPLEFFKEKPGLLWPFIAV